mgnify:CR=1 FL=1
MKKLLNEWRDYSEYHELFERHEYIEHVLGFKPLLSESGGLYYSSEVRRLIIEEQLLLEGFFSDAKKVGSDMFSLVKIMKNVVTDPNRLKAWKGNLRKMTIKRPLRAIQKLINVMIQKLPQLNMPTFAKWAEGIKGLLDSFSDKINNAQGWRGGIFITGAALAIKYVWDNIGEYVDAANKGLGSFFQKLMGDEAEGQQEGIIEQLKEFLNEKVVNPIKKFLVEKIKGAIGAAAFDSIAGWVSWAKKAFDGAKFISGALGDAISRQTVKLGGT